MKQEYRRPVHDEDMPDYNATFRDNNPSRHQGNNYSDEVSLRDLWRQRKERRRNEGRAKRFGRKLVALTCVAGLGIGGFYFVKGVNPKEIPGKVAETSTNIAIGVGKGIVEAAVEAFNKDESEATPRGTIHYQTQTIETSYKTLVLERGHGKALVQVYADRKKDNSMWADDHFYVRDPQSHGPANIEVETDYCISGVAKATTDKETNKIDRIEYAIGGMGFCGARVANTTYNNYAFDGHDAGAGFAGVASTYMKNAITTTAKAGACPTNELNAKVNGEAAINELKGLVAQEYAVTTDKVTIIPGVPVQTSDATKQTLKDLLDMYAAGKRPKDLNNPNPHEVEAGSGMGIKITYSGDSASLDNSCYIDRNEASQQPVPQTTTQSIAVPK